MKIEIKKSTNYQCAYNITRGDGSVEHIVLETKTYLVHDVCHYVVEKHMGYSNGFWGLLSQGYAFNELFGKENMLTTELRFIEQIVGPVQSAFLGNISRDNFELFVQHIDFKMPEDLLNICLNEITHIVKSWEQLPIGGCIVLEWNSL